MKVLGFSGVLEFLAMALVLVSVGLTVRQNVLCWPVGAVSVVLYALVFWVAQLYAGAGLQVFFFAMQFYGWYQWLHGGRHRDELPVTSAPWWLVIVVPVGAISAFALGLGLATWTDQKLPYLDASVTAFSLVAQ